MDEIDWIKHTKKAIIFVVKSVLIFIGALILLVLISMIKNGVGYGMMNIIVLACIGISIIFFEIIAYGVLYIIYKVIYGSQKKIVLKKEYLRETCNEYTPAIASLVYDLKVDVYRDYTATMLHLYNKGYLSIFDDNKICKIEINEEKDFSVIENHERYVIDCLNKEKKFDENVFKEILVSDTQSKKLLTDKKESKIFRITIVLLIALITMLLSYFINKILFTITFVIIFSILITWYFMKNLIDSGQFEKVVDTLYKRTKKGEELAKEMRNLKRFLNEYTLIKDREIEHIQVLEEYIPYAIVLGEAENIEKYIKSNTAYRNLIYNREKKG